MFIIFIGKHKIEKLMQERKRHPFLTLWLIVIIGANSIEAFRQFYFREMFLETYPQAPEWVFVSIGLLAGINIALGTALFFWKKWAFWGFLLSSLGGLLLYLKAGAGIQTLLGLTVVAVLYIALQLGGENKGWHQLD